MAIRLVLDVFSGVPDPVATIGGAEAREWLGRLRPTRPEWEETSIPIEVRLGYRGIILERQSGRDPWIPSAPPRVRLFDGRLWAGGLSMPVGDPAVEDDFCGTTGPFRPPEGGALLDRIVLDRARFRELILRPWPQELRPWLPLERCPCAPLYEPAWWNVPGRQWDNNCYNYATNHRTDTFAQPGLGSGAMYASISGPDVLAGAIADQLIPVPDADNHCPTEGHLVALVIDPGPISKDFHWYRKNRNGTWSHKPGGGQATNRDDSGNLIFDPRTADRGGYTEFISFMVVMHGHVKLA